ncbi:ABC transporter ATP-binding protein [Bacillus sp. 179-C3.3 HS]|uniref:ABC transporter ATP-binding protein n=1 Tax=Bacillus sp. 179-C3.3 HS TaxID=3232162 RepID=UPI0039A18CF8
MKKVLQIIDLHVSFQTYGGSVQAVRGVNLDVYENETLVIVGESGCGKSVTSQSIMRLLPAYSANVEKGEIWFHDRNLLTLSEKQMRAIRGVEISMIFQDPMTALNPTLTIGDQLMEAAKGHQKRTKKEIKEAAVQMLDLVGIPEPKERLKQYPHQFSGGMRQRLMIAMALICEPQVLIADEPTTALDVTIQAQILEQIQAIQQKTGISIIFITHDLGVVAQVADRVAVMYGGKIVELGTRRDIFYHPQHPYTKGLLRSVPRLDLKGDLIPIEGSPPDLFAPPKGCPYTERCPDAMKVCDHIMPHETHRSSTHSVCCWLQDERAKQTIVSLAQRGSM